MHIRMLPSNMAPAGWVATLMASGQRVTWGVAPFGATDWVIKRDGVAVILRQAKDRLSKVVLDNPTTQQLVILNEVVSTGVAKLMGAPHRHEAAHG